MNLHCGALTGSSCIDPSLGLSFASLLPTTNTTHNYETQRTGAALQEALTPRSGLGSGRLVRVLLCKLLQALFQPLHHSRLHEQARVVQVVYDKLLGSWLGLIQAQDVFARRLVTALRGIA